MSLVRRETGIARWRQIGDALRADIAAGAFAADGRLPTEAALAERFGVNRHTVRQAMAALERDGLVRIEQGRGSFVAESAIDYPVGRRTRFTEILERQQRVAGGRVLQAIELPAGDAVAAALRMRRGQPVIQVTRLTEADGRPLGLSVHHFQKSRVPGLIEAFRRGASVTRALRACGIADYVRATTRLSARLPTAEEARHLRQRAIDPVLVSEAVNLDPQGRPIEYGVTCFAGGRVKLVFEAEG